MAGPYGPPASDVFHKYLNNQSLVPNQGLDSADSDSIPLLLLPQPWRGGGGGSEGTSPSGIGTRHAVALPGRGGSGSRRASGSGTGTQPEPALSVRQGSQPTQCNTLGLARGSGPFEPPTRGEFPPGPPITPPPSPSPVTDISMAREATATVRVSAAELAEWRGKARAAGVSLSELLRRAMARTRTWTAAAAAVERERTRELARIGNNLNQLARWANTHKGGAEAVAVVAHLSAIERALDAVSGVRRERETDAR